MSKITEWPQSKIAIRLIRRKRGATVSQLAHALGGLQPHTVRSMVSRLNSSGEVTIALITIKKRRYYRLVSKAENGR